MSDRLAVFAGTYEGHALCKRLSDAGVSATAFVATPYGAELLGGLAGIEVREGRLDEGAMLETLSAFDVVVDATHPYAVVVSANLRSACERLGLRYVRLLRPSGEAAAAELADAGSVRIERAESCEDAARVLSALPGRVLVTTGSKDLPAYTSIPDFEGRLVVRILPMAANLERALDLGYPARNVICMQGPFSHDLNVAMLRQIGASWLVTKDTGAPGGLPEKISAAGDAGCGVVLISRPDASERGLTLDEAVSLLVNAGAHG